MIVPKASPRSVAKSSTGADTCVGKSRRARRLISAVMQKLKGRFGSKVSLELALRANADQRSSERWLSGGGIDGENFAQLIRSDVGDDVIEALMGDDPRQWPDWYALFRKQVRLSKLRRDQVALQRELAALEQGAQ